MRNLKRALSMALAAVMLLGMMVIGASAAGYSDLTDTDEIVNKEAVALLVDLGVIDGKSSGRYDPTGTLERVEFTKLVFGMMMGQNSDATVYEDAGIFSDVDSCWGEGFINYCASIGIVSGVGKDANGKDRFSPYSSLTVAATAKMLLVALGYHDDDRGYNGDAWTVNVMRDAQAMGLLDGVTGQSANEAITRDNAAQMIFNALFATTKNAVMLPGGDVGAETVAYYMDGPSLAESRYGNLYAVEGVLENYGGAGETVIGGRTVQVESEVADIGTTVVYYRNDDGLVSTVAVTADKHEILGTSYGGATLTALSTRGNRSFIALADTEVSYFYQNGISTPTAIAAAAAETNIDALVDNRGVITDLIDNDADGRYDVVRITEKSVATLTGPVTLTTAGSTTYVEVPGVATSGLASKVFGYEDLASGDVVLYYTDVNNNTYIEKAEAVSGVMTETTEETNIGAVNTPATYTIGGVKYNHSQLPGSIGQTNLVTYEGLSGVTYYLDNGGYIIEAVGTPAPTDLMMILKNDTYGPDGVFQGGSQQSQVLFVDATGETGIVKLYSIDGTVLTSTNVSSTYDNEALDKKSGATYSDNGNAATASFYTYEESSNGYILRTPLGRENRYYTDITTGLPTTFSSGHQDGYWTSNSNTIYLVRDRVWDSNTSQWDYLDTFTVYQGYENVPTITNAHNIVYAVGQIAQYVVVDSYTTIDNTANDLFYAVSDQMTAVYRNNSGLVDYYYVTGIYNGAIVNLKLNANAAATLSGLGGLTNKLFNITRYDVNGYVDIIAELNDGNEYYTGMTGTTAAASNVLMLDTKGTGYNHVTKAFSYTNDTVVYTVNNGVLTVGTVANISTDDNDLVTVVTRGGRVNSAASREAVIIYIQKKAPTAPTYDLTVNGNGVQYSTDNGLTWTQNAGGGAKITGLEATDVLLIKGYDANWVLNSGAVVATGCTVTYAGDGIYRITNFSSTSSITVTATAARAITLDVTGAIVTVNGKTYTAGAGQALGSYAVGDKITLQVVFADGTTTKSVTYGSAVAGFNGTYIVTVDGTNTTITVSGT